MTEPFVIRCETCNSRLRVRSAAAIGSILSCPKCQSLVHVTRPDEEQSDAAESSAEAGQARSSDSSAPTEANLLPLKIAVAAVSLAVVVAAAVMLWPGQSSDAEPGAINRVAAADNSSADTENRSAPDGENAQDAAPQVAGPEHVDGATQNGPNDPADEDVSARPPALPQAPPVSEANVEDEDGIAQDWQGGADVPAIGIPQLDIGFPTESEGPPNGRLDSPVRPRGAPSEETSANVASDGLPPNQPPASTMVRMRIALIDAGDPAIPAGRPAEPLEALSLPLAGLSLQDASPVDVIRLIADLTATTITITPEAFHALETLASHVISAEQTNSTAREALAAILDRCDLRIEKHGSHLVVSATDPTSPPLDAGGNSGEGDSSADKLAQLVTFTFSEPTPLVDVLHHLERVSGLRALVDWPSLETRQLQPGSLVTASAVELPLADVLDGLLPQLGLRWTPLDGGAIWITAK